MWEAPRYVYRLRFQCDARVAVFVVYDVAVFPVLARVLHHDAGFAVLKGGVDLGDPRAGGKLLHDLVVLLIG